ncbi:MAG: YfcE family phosphodiesterase, partial [Candidatus Bipolaricaulaceae bacterium]
MLIGVLSDTHDNLANLRRFLALFRERGVELVLHAGDFVSPFTAEPFRETGLRVIGVFGNNDGDKLYLQERFRGLGELHHGPHELALGGRRVLL